MTSTRFYKIIALLFLIQFSSFKCFASEPIERADLKKFFDKYELDGSILIYDQNKNIYEGYNLERCNQSFVPASTFKIASTLIALESGAVSMDSIFAWDGTKKLFASWEKDMTIKEAFKTSNLPLYKVIIKNIGVDVVRYYTQLFHYGRMDINSENIDNFWLEGTSGITQYEQIYFLKKLYNLELPIKEENMKLVKDFMINETGENYTLSGKTGWSTIHGDEHILWFVGYVESAQGVHYFATNFSVKGEIDINKVGPRRISLTKEVLQTLGII